MTAARLTGEPLDSRARRRAGAALSGPAAFWLVVLLFLQASVVLFLSFAEYRLGMPGLSWTGIDNYARLFEDPRIRQSLSNTAIYVVVVAPVSVRRRQGANVGSTT